MKKPGNKIDEEDEEMLEATVQHMGVSGKPKGPICGKEGSSLIAGTEKVKYQNRKFKKMSDGKFARIHRAKKIQIEMIKTRGYYENVDEKFISEYESIQTYEKILEDMENSGNKKYSILDFFSSKYKRYVKYEKDEEAEEEIVHVYYVERGFNNKGKRTKAVVQEAIVRFIEYAISRNAKNLILITETGLASVARECLNFFASETKVNIEIFYWNELIINPTKHVMVPKHEILDNNEILEYIEYKDSIGETNKFGLTQRDLFLRKNYDKIKFSEFPIILDTDPIIKFLGGKKNDIIKITRYSILSTMVNTYITYRIVNVKSQKIIDIENEISENVLNENFEVRKSNERDEDNYINERIDISKGKVDKVQSSKAGKYLLSKTKGKGYGDEDKEL